MASLSQRIPPCSEYLSELTLAMSLFTLSQEGQDAFRQTEVFKKLISTCGDTNYTKHFQGQNSMVYRVHLSSFFDRNAHFKDITKEFLNTKLDEICTQAANLTKEYMKLCREKHGQEKKDAKALFKKDNRLESIGGILFLVCAIG